MPDPVPDGIRVVPFSRFLAWVLGVPAALLLGVSFCVWFSSMDPSDDDRALSSDQTAFLSAANEPPSTLAGYARLRPQSVLPYWRAARGVPVVKVFSRSPEWECRLLVEQAQVELKPAVDGKTGSKARAIAVNGLVVPFPKAADACEMGMNRVSIRIG